MEVIDKVSKSDFLCGNKGDGEWKANFDWIMKPDNFQKIIEGAYDNKGVKAPTKPLLPSSELKEWEEEQKRFNDEFQRKAKSKEA